MPVLNNQKNNFKKSLNLADSTAIVIGSMIGSGIFIVSADMARTLGSPGWLMIVWMISGLITVIAALSYGELAVMMPRAGGQYVYLKESYGKLSGFLYGWSLFFVIQTGTIAAVAVAFAKFSGVLIPWISPSNYLVQLGSFKVSTVQLIAILSIILLTLINLNGIRTGKIIQNIFTFSKLAALFGIIILGLFFVSNQGAFEINSSYFWDAKPAGALESLTGFALIAALGTSMVGSLFSSDAWNNITFTSGEVINPKKTIPKALFIGTLTVTIIYILANIVYLKMLPLRGVVDGSTDLARGIQFALNDRVGSAAMSQVFGETAALMMAVFIMVSTFGCNNGLILAGARVYYAMSLDNLFFKSASKLNKPGVPAAALVFQGIWSSLLCLTGTYSDLLDYVVFVVLIFYAMTIGGIFILRKKRPEAERPYRAFGYPVVPALYILAALFIVSILIIYKPNYTLSGLGIVLLGIPVYYYWRWRDLKNVENGL